MNRFLGTKTKILSDIHNVLLDLGILEGKICDIFSGSLAVSLFLKRKGYSIIANDLLPLSYSYSQAYLIPSEIPQFKLDRLLTDKISKNNFRNLKDLTYQKIQSQKLLFKNLNPIYKEFKSFNTYSEEIYSLAFVLTFLEYSNHPIDKNVKIRNDIFDYYTKSGHKSDFRSLRGKIGKRNYFIPTNAKKIDFILSQIRFWNINSLLNEQEKHTLICVLLDSMEKYVNIQGTYHDFPRDKFEARALKPFKILFPNYFGLLYAKRKHMAGIGDSLDYVKKAPFHDVMYIDPPYNFRQYSAYYHLPNFMVKYPDIDDLDNYLSKIQYVRGQNMDDDIISTFSKKDEFIPALKTLIQKSNNRYIIMSYFDGVNHWNKFLSNDNSIGFGLLKDFFSDSQIFLRDSLKIIPVNRVNYQSQNGYKAKKVTEYLFVAKRK